jgi:hypothetical protein
VLVANADEPTRLRLVTALTEDLVVNVAAPVRFVMRLAIAFMTALDDRSATAMRLRPIVAFNEALLVSVAEPVRFVTLTPVALTVALVDRLDIATLAQDVIALIVALDVSVAAAVLLLVLEATALSEALDANEDDAIDATTAIAVTIDARVCHPADPNVVLAGGNCNVDLEPMLALAVLAVPPVLEPNARPNAPNLGPAPIAWLGGNIPI